MKAPFFLLTTSATFAIGIGLSPISQAADDKAEAEEKMTAAQRIDQFIEAGYAANEVTPHPEISDGLFVRRVYLDIAGRIPTRVERQAFLDDPAKGKRNQLIGELLGSDGYVQHFTNWWSDLLRAKTRIAGNGNSMPAGYAYANWIKDAVRSNKPCDEMARELISANGSSWENGAVGYYLRDYGMPLDNVALTSQVFLGTQIVCAQCHDHPFDKWTQMEYYQMAAFTYGVVTSNNSENANAAVALYAKSEANSRKQKSGNRPNKVKNAATTKARDNGAMSMSMMSAAGSYDSREMRKAMSEVLFPLRFNNVAHTGRMPKLPHDYQYDNARPKSVVWPETPFGPTVAIDPRKRKTDDPHPSAAFAHWMTSPDNPRFTKVIVNRLWKKVMGYGLIEPVDEFRDETAASHPELLDFLEQRFVALDYDIQRFLRILYSTRTYQRATHTEDVTPGLPYYFPGPLLRRMSAEQIWDSMLAMIIDDPDSPSPEMELFGERRLTTTEWIARAVYDQDPADLLAGTLEIAALQRKLAKEIQAVQTQLAEAREDGDAEKINAAQRAVAGVRRQLQEYVAERIYRRGLEQKIELVSSGATSVESAETPGEAAFLTELAALLEREPDFLAKSGIGSSPSSKASDGKLLAIDMSKSRTKGAGYGGTLMEDVIRQVMAPRYQEMRANNEERQQRERREWGVDTPREKQIYNKFEDSRRRLVRAADLPSPAPNGHFLREFGQSDREVINNESDHASITQALELLNGSTINALGSQFSVLRRDLQSAENGRDAIRIIYQTMLSRDPGEDEIQLLLNAQRNGDTSATGIVWALLNTRQFLFIQ